MNIPHSVGHISERKVTARVCGSHETQINVDALPTIPAAGGKNCEVKGLCAVTVHLALDSGNYSKM